MIYCAHSKIPRDDQARLCKSEMMWGFTGHDGESCSRFALGNLNSILCVIDPMQKQDRYLLVSSSVGL
jgi:hypothetical protein